jgi:hypothetical protein
MAVDLELTELLPGGDTRYHEHLCNLFSDAIVKTVGILAEQNRREFWCATVTAQLEDLLEYAFVHF